MRPILALAWVPALTAGGADCVKVPRSAAVTKPSFTDRVGGPLHKIAKYTDEGPTGNRESEEDVR